jgi:glucose/arabinose dehydrogenase
MIVKHKPMKIRLFLYLFSIIFLSSCYGMLRSSGGGERVEPVTQRFINPDDVALPHGYRIEVVAKGLTFPTGIAFDETGMPYVTESGYSYGEVFRQPRLLKINTDGSAEQLASGKNNGPWNGVSFHEGSFYVAEGGETEGGKILKIDRNGKTDILTAGLPSIGDHHTNGPVIKDGYIYFGQGTATNSSVVGEDNLKFGWLSRHPEFHDIPCRDITLSGKNYFSKDLFNQSSKAEVETGAFSSFGSKTEPGMIITGSVPCSGSIMRIPLKGGKPELVAWGFRNPFGMSFDSRGQLFITENGYDDRGSRPVWGVGDYMWKVEQGVWYGWPDYGGGHELSQSNLKVPGEGNPVKILAEDQGEPPTPVASLGVHSSSCGFDFSRSKEFGFIGEAFITQFGDMSPNVGKVEKPVGFKVVRVDPGTGVINDFALNRKRGPASKLHLGGIERPVAARFSPDGKSLYIVDFGIMLTSKKGPQPVEGTGVIWKVTKSVSK